MVRNKVVEEIRKRYRDREETGCLSATEVQADVDIGKLLKYIDQRNRGQRAIATASTPSRQRYAE